MTADPCTRYARRLDAHLATLANDTERRGFLDREHNKWIDRFETFQRDVLRNEYTGTATAFDYTITLADISIRRARYAPVKAEA